MAYMILLGSDFKGKAKSTHSKAANTADTVGTARQSHSAGVGPAICFDAGACELSAVLVGVPFRTGSRQVECPALASSPHYHPKPLCTQRNKTLPFRRDASP